MKKTQKNTTINDLAFMVKKGFDQVDERFDTLERGQEEIKLKLDNVAYRFEMVELQKRVEVLEKKLNIQFSR